jgi:hypothetical protein
MEWEEGNDTTAIKVLATAGSDAQVDLGELSSILSLSRDSLILFLR